ncbi:COX6A-domain-containing protein [Nadsonia fulvescens var. elongata DSM 6958]|uniref:Cytochrome c oxidase subunit 13, mitochondrial n=1 Tax=Nadsonia fulvescens var. elongata DSM 6958 TaxID=857566 RepID=A0A1E3PHR2_9ASCO|nr:COX6A-domain-containing protein [Nadsonia fulvescens var. elongata DSM 6958]
MFALRRAAAQAPKATLRRANHHGAAPVDPSLIRAAHPWGANPAAGQAFKQTIDAAEHHAVSTTSLWKKVSIFVVVPAIVATAVNTYFVEVKHAEHRAHRVAESEENWPAEFGYQNVRVRSFFWGDGDKTLFWTDKVNRHKQE